MKLEEIILFQIDQTTKIAKQYSQKEFDRLRLGITVDQWVLLKIIDEAGDLSQKDLAAKSSRDPASITRTLDILQNKELILRDSVYGNRRAYHVKLSPYGKEFVDENMKIVNMLRAKSIEGFSNKETNELLSMLIRIQENMR